MHPSHGRAVVKIVSSISNEKRRKNMVRNSLPESPQKQTKGQNPTSTKIDRNLVTQAFVTGCGTEIMSGTKAITKLSSSYYTLKFCLPIAYNKDLGHQNDARNICATFVLHSKRNIDEPHESRRKVSKARKGEKEAGIERRVTKVRHVTLADISTRLRPKAPHPIISGPIFGDMWSSWYSDPSLPRQLPRKNYNGDQPMNKCAISRRSKFRR